MKEFKEVGSPDGTTEEMKALNVYNGHDARSAFWVTQQRVVRVFEGLHQRHLGTGVPNVPDLTAEYRTRRHMFRSPDSGRR